MSNSLRNRLIKNTSILTLITLISKGAYYLFFVLVARYMGPASFGQLTFAIIVGTTITRVINFGTDVHLNKLIATDKKNAGSYIEGAQATRAILSLFGFVICAIFLAAFSSKLGSLYAVMIVIFLRQLLESFRELYVAAIQAYQEMFYQALVVIPTEIGLLGFSLYYLKYQAPSLYGLSLLLLAFSTLRVIGLMLIIRVKLVKYSFRINQEVIIKMLKDSWPIGAGIIAAFLMGRIDIILLTFFAGEKQVGYYQAAYTLMDAVVIFFGTIRASLFPNLVYFYKNDKRTFYRLHTKANIFFAGSIMIVSVLMFFAARIIVAILYGDSYDATVNVLEIFSLGTLFTGLGAFMGSSLIAMDKQRPLMIITLLGCLITFCLNLILIPRYGVLGSAWANVATYSTILITMMISIERERKNYA